MTTPLRFYDPVEGEMVTVTIGRTFSGGHISMDIAHDGREPWTVEFTPDEAREFMDAIKKVMK